jgi:hypothetical protein
MGLDCCCCAGLRFVDASFLSVIVGGCRWGGSATVVPGGGASMGFLMR